MKEAIKRAVAEAAETYGAEGYEVKMGSSTSAAVEALKDDISSVTYEKSTSISVRCVKGGKSGYASGNIVTPEEAAELVRRACESALVVDDADEVPLFEGSPEYKKVEKKEVIIPSAEEMIKDTMDIQTKLMAQEKVVEGSQSFMQVSASESSFFNSAGLDLAYESGYVAKGAADMTLTDDNFATIVDAVREGRGIYANIKKVVGFICVNCIVTRDVYVVSALAFNDIRVSLTNVIFFFYF